jgi:hypothetical protein
MDMQARFQLQRQEQPSQLSSSVLGNISLSFFFFWLFLFLNPAHAFKSDPVHAQVELAFLTPSASPYALPANAGKITVRFSVPVVGKANPRETIYLRRIGDKRAIAMNDLGKDGDFIAQDGIVGINVLIDTSKVQSDSCLFYEAFTKINQKEFRSQPMQLCVSSFPVGIAKSRTTNSVEFPGGTKAVADEVLISVTPETTASAIRQLADSINASVVGTILPLHRYQLKLPSSATAEQLLAIVAKLAKSPNVKYASINAIGQAAFTPTDPDFSGQHGLQLVRAQDAWDVHANANGTGITVVVLDTGIDRNHPDFGTSPGNCQLAEDDCGSGNTDVTTGPTAAGHGTQVAGVFAAKTNNALGVAGAAFGSKIHSINVAGYTSLNMESAFTAAAVYMGMNGNAQVINASFNVLDAFSDMTPLCMAINSAVLNGATPRAIVVNSAGNDDINGASYPARCNDLNAGLTNKNLLITVSNSTSIVTPDCGSVAIGQRCSSSNYGSWVDIAAPGSAIRTTTIGGGFTNSTGTSFSAPIVSGAVAILRSCGVALVDIEATLKSSADPLNNVPFPASGPFPPGVPNPAGTTPRLDIFRALQQLNLPPTAVSLSSSSINENTDTSAGFEVGTLTTIDPNTCDKFTYSIFGGADMAAFSLGGAGLDRLVITAGVLNFEVKSSYSVIVRVTDFFGLTFDQPLTISVTNVNEAPAGTNATITINEDTVHTFTAANFGFSDPGDMPTPNNLSAVIISTVPAAGTLALSAVPVIAGQSIAAASIGNLTFTPAANANGNGYASFTFQVVDDGGTANGGINTDPTPNTLTFNVTPVNDLPTGMLSFTGTLSVGQTLTANTATIADADGLGAFNYQWRRNDVDIPGASSSTYTLVPADFGTVANLHVSYTDGGGTVENLDTTNATNTGDPHITAVDGLHFDFQAAGEFVALRGKNGMEIQTRQTPVSTAAPLADNYSELPVGVSINTAVAARVGKHRVTLQPGFSGFNASSDLLLRIDGVRITLPASGIDLGSGGRVVGIAGGAYQIDFPDTTTLVVTPGFWAPHNVWYLNVAVFHTPAHEGIMGIREKGSWLPILSNGSSLGARPVALHDRYVDLYEKFASSWRVTNESSLFDYARHTSTKTFTLKDWPRENPPHVIPQGGRVTKPLKRELALEHCRAVAEKNNHADCVFDVMVTGHDGFAKTMLFAQKIQGGLTATVVREDKDNARPNRNLRFIATVIKHAPAVVLVTGDKDTSAKAVANNIAPSGFIQFKLNGRNIGNPVKLDSPGQAILNIPRDKVGAAQIGASYLPAKGSVFLPSSSSNLSNSLDELKMRSRVLKKAK